MVFSLRTNGQEGASRWAGLRGKDTDSLTFTDISAATLLNFTQKNIFRNIRLLTIKQHLSKYKNNNKLIVSRKGSGMKSLTIGTRECVDLKNIEGNAEPIAFSDLPGEKKHIAFHLSESSIFYRPQGQFN